MNRRERLAALMKSDAEILGLITRWASLNKDIGQRDQLGLIVEDKEDEGAATGPAVEPGTGPVDYAGAAVTELRVLREEREECARQYNAREAVLTRRVGL